MSVNKGIVLAGGIGSRLYPLTAVACKQLLPVYDKPLIYYPLATLMQFGIREILIISTPSDIIRIKELFKTGLQLGLNIYYEIQEKPEGIAQALLIGEKFIDKDPVALILGDNIFYGIDHYQDMINDFENGGLIFGYSMKNPSAYGVLSFNKRDRPVEIEEKPFHPKSNYAVTGFYIYDGDAVSIAKKLIPSERGELEITDVNNEYLKRGQLNVIKLGRGIGWLDTGTFESLLDAGNFIATIEKRQGLKIGCIEEIAFRKGYIDKDQLQKLINDLPENSYKKYLNDMIRE